jgi:hypothetical protein
MGTAMPPGIAWMTALNSGGACIAGSTIIATVGRAAGKPVYATSAFHAARAGERALPPTTVATNSETRNAT